MTWMEEYVPPPWYKRSWRTWPILRRFFGFRFKRYSVPRVRAKFPELDVRGLIDAQPMQAEERDVTTIFDRRRSGPSDR